MAITQGVYCQQNLHEHLLISFQGNRWGKLGGIRQHRASAVRQTGDLQPGKVVLEPTKASRTLQSQEKGLTCIHREQAISSTLPKGVPQITPRTCYMKGSDQLLQSFLKAQHYQILA